MPTRLVDLTTGVRWELRDDEQSYRASGWWYFNINRKARAYVTLSQPWISKHHGAVLFKDGTWLVFDGYSGNGITVNGERLDAGERRALADGDVLGLVTTRLRFESTGPLEVSARRAPRGTKPL